METDAASSNASSDSHVGSFCQSSNLNYYSENSFFFASSCKLDNYLTKKTENGTPKKVDYALSNNKNISKTLVNTINKKVPSNSGECYLKKNSDEFGLRRFQNEYFNNNNNNSAVSDKQEINIQLNAVNSFGNKPISFSPDQVST